MEKRRGQNIEMYTITLTNKLYKKYNEKTTKKKNNTYIFRQLDKKNCQQSPHKIVVYTNKIFNQLLWLCIHFENP